MSNSNSLSSSMYKYVEAPLEYDPNHNYFHPSHRAVSFVAPRPRDAPPGWVPPPAFNFGMMDLEPGERVGPRPAPLSRAGKRRLAAEEESRAKRRRTGELSPAAPAAAPADPPAHGHAFAPADPFTTPDPFAPALAFPPADPFAPALTFAPADPFAPALTFPLADPLAPAHTSPPANSLAPAPLLAPAPPLAVGFTSNGVPPPAYVASTITISVPGSSVVEKPDWAAVPSTLTIQPAATGTISMPGPGTDHVARLNQL